MKFSTLFIYFCNQIKFLFCWNLGWVVVMILLTSRNVFFTRLLLFLLLLISVSVLHSFLVINSNIIFAGAKEELLRNSMIKNNGFLHFHFLKKKIHIFNNIIFLNGLLLIDGNIFSFRI